MGCICQEQNFRFARSATFTLSCTYQSLNPTPPPPFVPIPLTGTVQIYMTCKRYKNDPDSAALFQLEIGTGVTITGDGTSGKFQCVVPEAATENLPVDVPFFYDVWVNLGTARDRVMHGVLTLDENTTQS